MEKQKGIVPQNDADGYSNSLTTPSINKYYTSETRSAWCETGGSEKLFYRILISMLSDDVKYDSFTMSNDEDMQVLFHYRRQFLEFFGGSNQNPQSLGHPACSSSMLVGASLTVTVIVPEVVLVASPSFAANLNSSGDAGVGETGQLGEVAIAMPSTPVMVPVLGEGGVPDGIEDALHDDDVEPATIADDSDDDIPRTTPVFQDKEEVVLSVKTYSIRYGVEYKVLESDNRKYFGKCKEFGNGCTWLIRVSLRQCRGIWVVKWYNDTHTCLATSITSYLRMLDYHVISAFILPMIRADVTVSIKVLQNATEAHLQEGLDG
ncbi:uncharacterized protein LOC107466380 [Arachis duranensis]|uniref:Uncharacterized protein LOC107466380 n=1 Tax=Arachis duranensis TaxID=130453 RepID=A0A6P4C2C8_ARADU|nr:uncharacterized protein LOC107466380 [Arachis duranensis]